MHIIPFKGIQFVNSRSPVFRTGTLRFDPNREDAIFNALNHPNWKETVWSEEDIVDALLYPTVAKMQRILNVKDFITMERIKGKLVYLNNTNIRKPIQNVVDVVNGRLSEVQRGRTRTEIKVTLPEDVVGQSAKENEELKKKNSDLEATLLELKEQVAALMKEREESVSVKSRASRSTKKTE